MAYLDLDETKIKTLPRLILRNLVKLQYLQIDRIEIGIDDVKELKNLEWFQATFAKLEEFNEYVSLLLNSTRRPSAYEVRVSCGLMSYGIHKNMKGTTRFSLWGMKDESGNKINRTELMFPQDVEIIIPSPEFVEYLYFANLEDNCHVFSELERLASSLKHMPPLRLCHKEKMEENVQLKGLFDAKLLLMLSNLRYLVVWDCAFMEELISTSHSAGVLNSSLEKFIFRQCGKLVRLLKPVLLSCFQNLELIRIDKCVSLESLISAANPIGKEASDNMISFPKLRHLVLADLLNLRSICNGILVCPFIETIHVRQCPRLKRLPLQLPVPDDNNGRSLPPQSSLAIICGEPIWWASLEWDHPHAKTPYFKPCLRCYADDDVYSAGRFDWPFYSQVSPDLA